MKTDGKSNRKSMETTRQLKKGAVSHLWLKTEAAHSLCPSRKQN